MLIEAGANLQRGTGVQFCDVVSQHGRSSWPETRSSSDSVLNAGGIEHPKRLAQATPGKKDKFGVTWVLNVAVAYPAA